MKFNLWLLTDSDETLNQAIPEKKVFIVIF